MIKYFIRTTLERELDESVSRELGEDYTLLVDYEHQPVKSFIEQLETISDYDSILLEDDAILCKNFKKHIEKAISEYPDKVINFFTEPYIWFTTTKASIFSSNVGTYYPKGFGKLIAKIMWENKDRYRQYDTIENIALHKLKIDIINYRPVLVQHNDNKSLLGNDNKPQFDFPRSSPFFIDYLEELDISYEDAWTKENKKKLIALMNSKFNKNNIK